MTYQRNIQRPFRLFAQQDALDEWLEHEVRDVQVRADDCAGDEDDDRAGQDLALTRPVDLLQLGHALGDEAAAPSAGPAAPGLGLRRLRGWADLGLALARALTDTLLGLSLLLLLLPVSAALLAGVPGHFLPRLAVRGMPAAPAAVFLGLEAVRGVPLRLHRLIVKTPALGAGEG